MEEADAPSRTEGPLLAHIGVTDGPDYKLLFDHMQAGVAYQQMIYEDGKATDFVFLAVNKAFEEITGLRDVVGKRESEVVPDVQKTDAEMLEICGRVAQSGQPERVEYHVQALDQWYATALYSPKRGQVVSISENITARKRAEEAWKASEESYRRLTESAQDVIWRVDAAGTVIFVNQAVEQMLGYTVAEVIGTPVMRYLAPEDVPRVDQMVREALGTDPPETHYRIEVDYLHANGSRVPVDAGVNIILDAEGQLVSLEGISRDVSAQKRAAAERARLAASLQQAQKLESVGRLAGGVAHDFNNMLSVILGHAELGLEEVDPTSSLYTDLLEIQSAGQRSAELTRRLLAFARKQTVAPQVLELNDTVSGMLKMLRRLIGEDIELAWLPGTDLPAIKMDPSQIDQTLANLCVNARDAIAGVGKITIETAALSFDEAYCADHPGFLPGDYVRLAVSDNGSGMDEETRSNLFEPFFTTKEVGRGTGLGLAMIYGIVKQNAGFLNVYSQLGQGSTFHIYLPVYEGTATREQPAVVDVPSSGHETILLVEDEPAILRFGKTMLQKLGYQVLTAATPAEALERAEQHQGEIQLLLTDVVMPEMSGRELAKQLLSRYPNMRRLFMSGYTADAIAHHGVLAEGVHFIQKPFSKEELSLAVRKALEEP